MNVYVSNRLARNKDWFQYSDERFESIKQELSREAKEHILNINETDYKNYLYAKYTLTLLQLDEDTAVIHPPRQQKHEVREQDGPERRPYFWECTIACHVEGSTDLWGIIPTVFSLGGRPNFSVSGNTLTFLFRIQSQNAEEFNREKDRSLQSLRNHIAAINNNATTFNAELFSRIYGLFTTLKNEYLQENSFFASINVTQNPDAPRTYSVPMIEKRAPIQKPTATSKSYTPEPTVDSKAYSDIIDCLTRVGLSIERKPSLYVDKDEEALRDLFLVQLELAFVGGTTTGETFNRSGKTDILLKNTDNTNLFVGECKVWKGPKYYLEAISQLLEYLTWDDSKTALLVFVKSVSLSTVIQSVMQTTLTHPSAVRFVGVRSDRFLQFTFRLPQDDQKHVAIEVMIFHFDKEAEGRG